MLGPDGMWFGHDGGNQGFQCMARLYGPSGSGVAVMTNGSFGGLVIHQFLLPKLATALGWPDAPASPSAPGAAVPGRYGDYAIEDRDGDVVLVVPGQPEIGLAKSERGWRATVLNLDVRFEGDDGIGALLVTQNGKPVGIAQDGIATDIRHSRS